MKKGDIVKFKPEWCEPSEADKLYIVLESGLAYDRVSIGALQYDNFFGHIETVEANMIQKA